MKKYLALFLSLCISAPLLTIPVKASSIETYTAFNCTNKHEANYSTQNWDSASETESYAGNGYSDNQISTFQIIGENNLGKIENTKTVKKYRASAFLEITFPNSKTVTGTATMIGASTALTAAHCVYNKSYGGFATAITIIPARNLTKNPYGKTTVTTINIPNVYKTTPAVGNDIAVINLKSSIGKKSGYLGCAVASSKNLLDHYNYAIEYYGYPESGHNDINGSSKTMLGEQWGMGGDCTYVNGKVMRYDMDSIPGMSGAGIIFSTGSVIGVHDGYPKNNRTYNHGTRIDDAYLKWIKGLIK